MIIRDYQVKISEQAYGLLCDFKIAILTMQVRTGKTLTAINTAKLYGAKKVLFVTKLKAIKDIQQQFLCINPDFDMYVTNYESLHKVKESFDLIILDESHCLGQYPTPAVRVQELKRICTGKPIIYLSGTPSPESYSQLYHQLWVSSFSPWSAYQNFYKWHKAYGIPAVKYLYNRQIADYSKTKQEDVLNSIEHLMITYTQEQAGFTEMVEEEILYVPMSEKVKWITNKLKRDKIATLKDGSVVLADTAVKEMQKMHQCYSGTVKTEDGVGVQFDTTKAEFIKERFKGQKIAIFYKYIAEGVMLGKIFEGHVETDPMSFNKAGNDAVLIMQFVSGREGTDVSTADCLVMYNIDHAALSYIQARARLQTKDRAKTAKVYWIFTKGGMEKDIYDVVINKMDYTLRHYKQR